MSEDLTSRFSLRLPKELHERLTKVARRNSASLNTEMLRLIEKGMDHEFSPSSLDAALAELLPGNLLQRVKRHAHSMGLPSDAEAVRRLLRMALDRIESAQDILEELSDYFQSERNIRVLARDVLAAHSSVKEIKYLNRVIWFQLESNESGAIADDGNMFYSEEGYGWNGGMSPYQAKGLIT